MNGFISRARLTVLFAGIAAFLLLIVFNYGRFMLVHRPESVQPRIMTERGSILDRNGKILAVQTTLYNIAITRSAIEDKELFAGSVGSACSIPEGELLSRLNEEGADFFYLKKKISEGEKAAIAEVVSRNRLRGIRLEPVMSRTYPEKSLASHIVGFLGDDGQGLTGVEYSFQDILSPPVAADGTVKEGYNVMLTIDGAIQYELEKVARSVMEETKAEAVMILTVRAKTGEILSYVSEPSANLNTYHDQFGIRAEGPSRPLRLRTGLRVQDILGRGPDGSRGFLERVAVPLRRQVFHDDLERGNHQHQMPGPPRMDHAPRRHTILLQRRDGADGREGRTRRFREKTAGLRIRVENRHTSCRGKRPGFSPPDRTGRSGRSRPSPSARRYPSPPSRWWRRRPSSRTAANG